MFFCSAFGTFCRQGWLQEDGEFEIELNLLVGTEQVPVPVKYDGYDNSRRKKTGENKKSPTIAIYKQLLRPKTPHSSTKFDP
jgi:hypothetical protein